MCVCGGVGGGLGGRQESQEGACTLQVCLTSLKPGKDFLILYDFLSQHENLLAVVKKEFLISKTNISAGSQMVGQVVQFGSGWEGVRIPSIGF